MKTFTLKLIIILTLTLFYSLFIPFSLQKDREFIFIRAQNPLLVQDDFSKDPASRWIFLNAAKWDSESEYIVLTEPGSELVGVTWLRKNISLPFTAEFLYKVGGGSGADGFVYMFYKDWDYEPGIGGFLGFLCREVTEPCPRDEAPGYGLEFDNYYNSKEAYGETYGEGDPSANHIAIIKDHIGNHLTHVNDSRTEDNLWHHVKLILQEEEITLLIDGEKTLIWAGLIDRSHSHMGFGSGIWGFDHRHIIDDFELYGNTIIVKGLQPGWTVELISDGDILGKSLVISDDREAVIDVTEFDIPLKGYFKVYKQTEIMFESPTFDNIWGGDIWFLSISTSEQPIDQLVEFMANTQTIAIVIGVAALVLLIGFISYRVRRVR